MKIKGMIKSVQAAIAAGGADVTQVLKVEILEGNWHELRDLMQKPIEITIEASQMEFGGGKSPLDEGAVEAEIAPGRGRKQRARII